MNSRIFKKGKRISGMLAAIMLIFSSTAALSHAETRVLSSENTYSNYMSLAGRASGGRLVLASDKSYADSLSAINLIYKNNDKLMLINEKTDIDDVIKRLNPSGVTIVGGPETIPENIVRMVRKHKSDVSRVYGSDRYDTNMLSMKGLGNEVIVASGTNFADAISSTNLIKEYRIPVMLVKKNQNVLNNGKSARFTVGGPASVTKSFGTRISGPDRYNTNNETLRMIDMQGKLKVNASDFRLPLMATNLVFKPGSDYLIEFTKEKNPVEYVDKNDVSNMDLNGVEPVITDGDNGFKNMQVGNKKFTVIDSQKDIDRYIDRIIYKDFILSGYAAVNPDFVKDNFRIGDFFLSNLGLELRLEKKNSVKYRNGKEYVLSKVTLYCKNGALVNEANPVSVKSLKNNINGIAQIIKDSGADRKSGNKEKADTFAKYLKTQFPYYTVAETLPYGYDSAVERIARYPFTIVENRTAVCEGFVLAFQEGMRQMGIPSYSRPVLNGTHIISVAKVDGKWIPYDVTGYRNGPRPDYKVSERELSGGYILDDRYDVNVRKIIEERYR